MKRCLLPHFNERKAPVKMLVLHATAHFGVDAIESLDKQKLSAHYLVSLEGEVFRLVEEKNRAWHAGVSCWRGENDLNSKSIGIEVCSLSLGQEPFSSKQIKSLTSLCKRIIKRYDIKPQNVVGHSDIAPLRKPDPGLAFPWEMLASKGVGKWFTPALKEKDTNVENLLRQIGYDVQTPEALKASAYAFCRHFLPEYVQKESDVLRLVDNFLPDNYDFMSEQRFVETLQAVAFAYR